jgi:hypothetical protein
MLVRTLDKLQYVPLPPVYMIYDGVCNALLGILDWIGMCRGSLVRIVLQGPCRRRRSLAARDHHGRAHLKKMWRTGTNYLPTTYYLLTSGIIVRP